MQGWMVKSRLSDTYGEIADTLHQGIPEADAAQAVADRVMAYDGSLWALDSQGPTVAEWTHTESGARLKVWAEFGPMPTVTRF